MGVSFDDPPGVSFLSVSFLNGELLRIKFKDCEQANQDGSKLPHFKPEYMYCLMEFDSIFANC